MALTLPGLGTEATAAFSGDGLYRYTLTRIWDRDLPAAMFIGMNPSTATVEENDPTVRRCMGFAVDWGYGGLLMGNLFAWRSTDPRDLPVASAVLGPVGEIRNPGLGGPWLPPGGYVTDEHLSLMAQDAGIIIAAWGAIRMPGGHTLRPSRVVEMFWPRLHVLGWTKDGHPRHPLYVRADTCPVPMRRPVKGAS